MSEATTEQPAVDATKTPAQPGVEAGQDARKDGDDVDTLLNEFQASTKTSEPAPQPKPEPKAGTEATPSKPDPAIAEVRDYIFRQDMNKTVTAVRGDLDPERFDDDFIEAWLDTRSRKEPRLAEAWVNRNRNPQAFQKVVAGLGREFSKKYGSLPDKQATEDREAVTAAVRGASNKAPEGQPPNFGSMTDAEFAAEKSKMFGG